MVGVKIQSGSSGGANTSGLSSIMSMFGGGSGVGSTAGKQPGADDPTTKDPTANWDPQQLQTQPIGASYAQGMGPTSGNDPFFQSLDAMGRRQTQIKSGKADDGSGGLSKVASIAAMF